MQTRCEFAAQVYSYSILLYELLALRVPFHDLRLDPAQIAVQVAAWSYSASEAAVQGVVLFDS